MDSTRHPGSPTSAITPKKVMGPRCIKRREERGQALPLLDLSLFFLSYQKKGFSRAYFLLHTFKEIM
jgi:hypothetical protein